MGANTTIDYCVPENDPFTVTDTGAVPWSQVATTSLTVTPHDGGVAQVKLPLWMMHEFVRSSCRCTALLGSLTSFPGESPPGLRIHKISFLGGPISVTEKLNVPGPNSSAGNGVQLCLSVVPQPKSLPLDVNGAVIVHVHNGFAGRQQAAVFDAQSVEHEYGFVADALLTWAQSTAPYPSVPLAVQYHSVLPMQNG
jgi:hypothetical protein